MLMAGDLPQQLNVREGTRYQHNVAGALAKNAVRDGNIATAGVPDWAIHLSAAATIRASQRPKVATYTIIAHLKLQEGRLIRCRFDRISICPLRVIRVVL